MKYNEIPRLAIFCKSFHEDVFRIRRLLESIQIYNEDNIPVYISVPAKEIQLFKKNIAGFSCHLLADEDILERGASTNGPLPAGYDRQLLQQIVKIEFWRMDFCKNYLWIDSDSYFIRPFEEKEFFPDDKRIYNVQYEGGELFEFAERHYRKKIISDYVKTAETFKNMFNRTGPCYVFGPSPLPWSCRVLKGLNDDFFSKQQGNVYDFFKKSACEMNLYGEYLLSSQKVPFVAREPFFKVFHYPEQFHESQYLGEWDKSLAKKYMGIVIQSNWAKPNFKKMNKLPLTTRLMNFWKCCFV